jgi:DNA-binding LacI/PurR family transcriptional regulator
MCNHFHIAVATIRDVAREAGVSTATVSRVLNGSGYVDRATAERVRSAVARLGYRPNVHWKRLASNSSETVCFLLGNRTVMNSMQMRMLMACERALAEAGYDLAFLCFRYSPDTPPGLLELPRLLRHQGAVDGVILAGVHHRNLREALKSLNLPHVVLGNTFLGDERDLETDAVIYDDVAGAYEATQYLLRLGHRRIAFVGNTALPWLNRRYRGYCEALGRAGLQPWGVTAAWDVSNIEYGQLAACELLREAEWPTAIFGGNDEIAAGVWKELVKRRVRIPEQISLMGFGDREEFSILEPPLASVSVFQDRLGAELARMLLEKLKKPGLQLPSLRLPCKVLERGSCGPVSSHAKEGGS